MKKIVTGNMGSKIKEFRFEVYIIDEGTELSGTYDMEVTHSDNTKTESTITFTNGSAYINLRHQDVAKIKGLPIGVHYEVDETAQSSRGYTVTSTNDKGTLTEDVESVWTNDKSMVVPTGVETASIPFASICILGSLLLLLYMVFEEKKRLYKPGNAR